RRKTSPTTGGPCCARGWSVTAPSAARSSRASARRGRKTTAGCSPSSWASWKPASSVAGGSREPLEEIPETALDLLLIDAPEGARRHDADRRRSRGAGHLGPHVAAAV